MFKGIRHCIFVAAVLIAVSSAAASAQMTIINTPTTDTLEKGRFYLEANVIFKPKKFENGGFQTYGYRTVYGLGRKTDVGVSFFYTRDGNDTPLEMNFSVKQNVYNNEKHAVGASVGAVVYVPLRRSLAGSSQVFTYANVGKTFKKIGGARVTAGAYRVFNGGDDFGSKGGATVAVEQPISRRFTAVGEWVSGNNRFGYGSAGLTYQINSRSFVQGTYNIGNVGRGNNFFAIYYGYTY